MAVLTSQIVAEIKVLHLDDNPDFLELTKYKVRAISPMIRMDSVLSDNEARIFLAKTEYDVIVCDFQLSENTGLDFLEELRNSGNEIPFIVFTGKGREEIAIRSLNLGADYYIQKTFSEDNYFELVHYIVRGSEKKRHLDSERAYLSQLKESEEKYRVLVDLYPYGIFVNTDGIIVFVNRSATKILEAENRELLLGKQALSFVHPDFRNVVIARIKELGKEGAKVPLIREKFIRLDGKQIDVEVVSTSILFMGKLSVLGVFRDVSEEIAIAQEREEVEEQLKVILENASDAIALIDDTGRLVRASPSLSRMFSYSIAEMMVFDNLPRQLMAENLREPFDSAWKSFQHSGTGPSVGKPVRFTGAKKAVKISLLK